MLVARGNTDVSLTELDASLCSLVSDVDAAYWDLFLQHRLTEIAVEGRNRALQTWQKENAAANEKERKAEAEAREQYWAFKVAAQQARAQVYHAETRLRFLMGIPATDGRLIRPADKPSTAKLSVDWQQATSEALRRSPAIREARVRVKQRELELSAAEKYVVPGDEKDSAAAIQKNKEGIANANLALARDRARLLDAELEVSSQLADALAVMGTKQRLVEANFNSQAAAQRNMAVVQVAHDLNRETISFDVLLQAQRSVADAHGTYLRSLADYAKAVSRFHFRKGTLLDYRSIELAERGAQPATPERAKQSANDPFAKPPAAKPTEKSDGSDASKRPAGTAEGTAQPKEARSQATVDSPLKVVQQATESAWKGLAAGQGRGTCRMTWKGKPEEKFDFEFAFDGDKFRLLITKNAYTHYIAICDGSATLVRSYYDKLASGPRVAYIRSPDFFALGPLAPDLRLPFIDLPRGPRDSCKGLRESPGQRGEVARRQVARGL